MSSEAHIKETWFNSIDVNKYFTLVQESVPAKITSAPPNQSFGDLEIACGPNIRLLATHENGTDNYRATILLVVKDSGSGVVPKIEYFIGPAFQTEVQEVKIESGEFPSVVFHQERDHVFYRFEVNLVMQPYQQKVKYYVNQYQNTNFEFIIPANNQSMNIMSYSCNGFSYAVDTSTFNGSLWLDVIRNHNDPEKKLPYHVMIGGGDQIYADAIKHSSKPFEKWLKHKTLHSDSPLTSDMVESFENFYLYHYIKWFGKGYWEGANGKTLQPLFPLAMSQIPSINLFDDHDIIDGFGSYNDRTMKQDIFRGVGTSAFKYYLLFQQHCSVEEFQQQRQDKFWIFGSKPGPYINEASRSMYVRLGKEIGFVGFDCRTERTKRQVITPNTYDLIFKRLQQEINESNGDLKHLVVLLGVPICYPRLVWVESIMSSKVLAPIRYLSRKGIILKGLVNEFDGSIELLDDLNDHWCAVHHKKERNWLMGKLVKLASSNGVRITILSGDVHLGCISRFKTKIHRHLHLNDKTDKNQEILANATKDPRLIFNVISSAIVNTAPPNGMATLLEKRSKIHHFDKSTDEDVVPLFTHDTDDSVRSNKLFMNKRNYADLIPLKNTTQLYNGESTTTPKKFYPGPTAHVKEFTGSVSDIDESGVDIPYDMDDNCLITTLHVEKDQKSAESKTYDYQVVIPSLSGHHNLTDVGIKN